MNFTFYFLEDMGIYFVTGLLSTIVLAIASIILGTVFGLIIGLMRLSKIKPVKWIASAYINFIRGVPLLVIIYIVYYSINLDIPSFAAAVIALTVNSAAYIAEIIRSGIQAVDKGQTEAARSLGMTSIQNMRYIVIPQAIKNILPALCNQFIIAIKDTSMVSVLGIGELTYNTDTIRSQTFLAFEPLIISAFIYFGVTYSLNKLVNHIEKKLRKDEH